MDINEMYFYVQDYMDNRFTAQDITGVKTIFNTCRTEFYWESIITELLKKGIPMQECYTIKQYVQTYGAADELINVLNNPISLNKLGKKGNIFNLLNPEFHNFWKEIANTTSMCDGKGVGKYEFLLSILLKDASKSDVGDIKINDNIIELKSTGGRCDIGGPLLPASCINTKFRHLTGITDKDLIITDGKKKINRTFDRCKNIIDFDEIIIESMFEQYNYIMKDDTFELWRDFVKSIWKDIIKSPGECLQKLYGILSIYCYNKVLNTDAMMIIKSHSDRDRTKYKSDDGNYVYLDKSDMYLDKLYYNTNIKIKNILRDDDGRSKSPQLDLN